MTESNQPTNISAPPSIRLPVDRVHAVVRSVWRLLPGGVLIGLGYLIGFQIGSWALFWERQSITFVAIGTFILILALSGLSFVVSGIRWLLLAGWMRPVHVDIDETAIRASLGPFGSDTILWSDVRCTVAEGFDADLLSQLDNDAFTPHIRDARSQRDVYAWLQSRTGVAPESLTGALRPYFESRLND